MLHIEIDNELVPSSLYKEERGAILFSFDLQDGQKVAVVSWANGKPSRYDCYVTRATAAGRPMLYSKTTGRELTSQEQEVLAKQPLTLEHFV